MRFWKKIRVDAIAIGGLMLVVGWYACSDPSAEMEGGCNDSLKKILFELGKVRLRIISMTDYDRPKEFFLFDRRQEVRQSGFEPVWRINRYILRDMNNGEEFDPFGYGGSLTKNKYAKDWSPTSAHPAYMPSTDLSEIYYYQLNGFHFVQRRSIFFGREYLYVRNIRKKDLEIKLEELILKDEAVSYNACALVPDLMAMDKSEAHLEEHGYVMKKQGDGYVPVCLDREEVLELPPKEIFIHDALRVINSRARYWTEHRKVDDYLGKRRFGEYVVDYTIDDGVVEKEALDLYDVKIRWNQNEQQYQLFK